MKLLAIDTASTVCAACVYDTAAGAEFGRTVLDLGKGHAEHLMGVVNDAMRQAAVDFQDLGKIVVAVGPGSFTGVRVGVSAARGFAMALKIPAVGVTTLEAIAAQARQELGTKTVMTVLDAGRGEINAAIYDDLGNVLYSPAVVTLGDAASLAREYSPVLAGSAAIMVAEEASTGLRIGPTAATADIRFYAVLGAAREAGEKPKPLYLREADAKPQAGFVLPRIQS